MNIKNIFSDTGVLILVMNKNILLNNRKQDVNYNIYYRKFNQLE